MPASGNVKSAHYLIGITPSLQPRKKSRSLPHKSTEPPHYSMGVAIRAFKSYMKYRPPTFTL